MIYLQSRGTQKILYRPMTINDINSSFFRHVQRICYDVLHIKMKLDAPTVKHSGTYLSLRLASSHVGKYIIHFLLYSWGFIICISVSLWLLNLSLLSTHLFTIIIIWCRIIRQIWNIWLGVYNQKIRKVNKKHAKFCYTLKSSTSILADQHPRVSGIQYSFSPWINLSHE